MKMAPPYNSWMDTLCGADQGVVYAAGCRHLVISVALQLVAVKQELAVRLAELTHVSTSLQEHKDSLAHTRSQLATVQDNLGGQLRALQRELSATQAEKLQSDREVGRAQQDGGSRFWSTVQSYAAYASG